MSASVPALQYVTCPDATGSHRMAYWAWGDASAAHVIVCVHGLSRQGRDFDVLAGELLRRSPQPLRIVCPDVVGRGRSDWLADPMGYGVPNYVSDMLHLLVQLQAQAPIATLDWVGTSMGGLIGMGVAGTPGLPLPVPLRRLVLNDVGPTIQWGALQRIGTYLGQPARWDTLQQAADAMWTLSTGFGPHTPAQWLALSQAMVKPLPDGGLGPHYDPAIAVPFRAMTEQIAAQAQDQLWQLYDAIRAETLLLRGADSDLLSPATAAEMQRRGPRARLVEFAGVGHAPTLVAADQVDAVSTFLLHTEPGTDEEPRRGAG